MKTINKIEETLARLTLEEKALLCSGSGSWHLRGIEHAGIPEIQICDGPHGLRRQNETGGGAALAKSDPATCFPTAAALASSWNRQLLYLVGSAIAEECIASDVSVILGPGANIKRSPLCGRNFEYYSEDPFLSGELAASQIIGTQEKGIGTSLKHYAANNQEYLRMTIDALVDERALHEIYLSGFERAVKQAEPWTVMCAYNSLNGDFASENHHLLTELLREDWGFKGGLVTDWGACNDRVKGLEAGQDIEMPWSGDENTNEIVRAVNEGRLKEELLDQAVERVLELIFRSDEQKKSFTVKTDILEINHKIAAEAAAECIILLKNTGSVLPLSPDDKILVCGAFARKPRYQGAGSSRINPSKLTLFMEEIRKSYPEAVFSEGYSGNSPNVDDKLISEAVIKAGDADKIIVTAGLPDEFESEGFDRSHLNLPESHNRLISELVKTGKPVIVCLSNGGPVEMPWNGDVQAVVECYLAGQAGAEALVNILTGKVNPSGKLAETFPVKLSDSPCYEYFPGGPRQVEYRESIYVGYRYYTTAGVIPLYPFGHGLSYTDFSYEKLSVTAVDTAGHEYQVKVRIKNTGTFYGRETVQLYIKPPESFADRPEIELKGFEKAGLAPGEEAELVMNLDDRSFAYYSAEKGRWLTVAGTYEIHIGASSEDIRLKTRIEIGGEEQESPTAEPDIYSRLKNRPEAVHSISTSDFEKRYCRPLPENILPLQINRNTTLTDFTRTLAGKLFMIAVNKMSGSVDEIDENSAGMYDAMIKEMPLRGLAFLGGDILNLAMVDALVEMGNGRFFRGLFRLIKAFLKNR